MATKSLKARNNTLASTAYQLDILNGGLFAEGELPRFEQQLQDSGVGPLRPRELEILQLNLVDQRRRHVRQERVELVQTEVHHVSREGRHLLGNDERPVDLGGLLGILSNRQSASPGERARGW